MWNLEKFSNNTAFLTEAGEKITYAELNMLQEKFFCNLKARSLIFIVTTNTQESIVAYISSIMNGMVPMLLDNITSSDMLYTLLDNYMPKYIYAPAFIFDNIMGYKIIRKDNIYILYEIEKNINYKINKNLALLLPTSGSTGSSKYVRLSYENIEDNTKAIIDFLQINETDRTVTSLPMCYAYGLSVINTYLYAGASIVLTDIKIIHSDFWRLIKEKCVTSFSGVPYMYKLCQKMNVFSSDFPNLKILTQAGGKLDCDLQEYYGKYCVEFNKKFYIMYGQTEATARMSYLQPDKMLTKAGSIGKPVRGGEFLIFSERCQKINKPYEQGEIIYKGRNVYIGYSYTYMDLDKSEETNNVLHTGDYGYFDSEGYWYVTGRKDKYVKLMGKRIDLAHMEHILFEHYGEKYICSIGNEKINIFGEGDENEILNFISQRIGINKGLIQFSKQKIYKWKETIEEEIVIPKITDTGNTQDII